MAVFSPAQTEAPFSRSDHRQTDRQIDRLMLILKVPLVSRPGELYTQGAGPVRTNHHVSFFPLGVRLANVSSWTFPYGSRFVFGSFFFPVHLSSFISMMPNQRTGGVPYQGTIALWDDYLLI